MSVLARLPDALEVQLQRDAQLSFLEYYVLAALSESEDRRLRLSDLAEITNAELSRISHLVKRLENRGLLRREPDPTNARYTLAILTRSGMACLARAAPDHVAQVRSLVFDVLQAGDLKRLEMILDRINGRILPSN